MRDYLLCLGIGFLLAYGMFVIGGAWRSGDIAHNRGIIGAIFLEPTPEWGR